MNKAAVRMNNVEGRMETFPNLSGPFWTLVDPSRLFPPFSGPIGVLSRPFRTSPNLLRTSGSVQRIPGRSCRLEIRLD